MAYQKHTAQISHSMSHHHPPMEDAHPSPMDHHLQQPPYSSHAPPHPSNAPPHSSHAPLHSSRAPLHSSHAPPQSSHAPPLMHSMDGMYPAYQESHMTSMDEQGQGHHIPSRNPHVTYSSSVYPPPPPMLPSPSMGVPHDISVPHNSDPSSHSSQPYQIDMECTPQPLDLSTKPRRPDDFSHPEFRSISPRDVRDVYQNKYVGVTAASRVPPSRMSPYSMPPRMSSRSPLSRNYGDARTESPYYREQTPSPQSFTAGYNSAYMSSMRTTSTPESFGSGSLSSSHPLTSSDGVLNGLTGGAYRTYEPMGEIRDESTSSRTQAIENQRIPEQALEDEGPKYMDLDSATSNYLGSRNITHNSNSTSFNPNSRVEAASSSPQSFSPQTLSPVKSQSIISGKDHCPKSRLVKEHLQKEMEKESKITEQISSRVKTSPSSESPIPPYPSIPYSSRADPTALPNPTSKRANPTALPNPSANRANPTALPNPSLNRANPTALPNPTSNRANPTALPNPSSNRANPTSLPTLPKIQRSRAQAQAQLDNRSNVQLDPDSSSDSKNRGKSGQGHMARAEKAANRLTKGAMKQNGSNKNPRGPKGSRVPVKRKSPSPDPSSNGSTGSPASGSPINHENEDLSNNMGSLATQIPTGKSFINFDLLEPDQKQADDRIIKRIVDNTNPGDIQVEYFESEGIQKMRMNLLELIAYSVEDYYMSVNKERRPSVGLSKA